jgi:DNA-binding FadR family transcriptional regulator
MTKRPDDVIILFETRSFYLLRIVYDWIIKSILNNRTPNGDILPLNKY